MNLNKAIKTLKQKGTGFLFKMNEMEMNYNAEKFIEDVQTHGYILMYTSDDEFEVKPFKLIGSGYPYQFIDFLELESTVRDDDASNNCDGWGWYSFMELYNKFIDLPLSFGIHTIVHKETEKAVSLYKY